MSRISRRACAHRCLRCSIRPATKKPRENEWRLHRSIKRPFAEAIHRVTGHLDEEADNMGADNQTIGQFFGEFFPGRVIFADLERIQTFLERVQTAFEPVVVQIGEMADRLNKLLTAPGYEPMLIQRGHYPGMARAVSYSSSSDLMRHFGAHDADMAAAGRLFEQIIDGPYRLSLLLHQLSWLGRIAYIYCHNSPRRPDTRNCSQKNLDGTG
jgi:hypothetical protein